MRPDQADLRSDLSLILGRLNVLLEQVGNDREPLENTLETWRDENHIYLEAILPMPCDSERLDLCLFGSRLFLTATR